jgi:glycosyltransferase involved in cell wall biosynthesis
MRIAYITPEFVTEPYYSGGLANYVNRIARALAARGHEIHVLVRAEEDERFGHCPGVTVHRVAPAPAGSLAPLSLPEAPDMEAWLRFSLGAAMHIERLHGKGPLDVVQAPNSRACGLFTMLRTAIPAVTRISCYRPLWNEACGVRPTPDTRGVETAELLQLKVCRHIFAPSLKLAGVLEQEANIRDVSVIGTPAYVEVEREDPVLYERRLLGRRYLLYVGRYQKHKGFDVLARALQDVLAGVPDVFAVFAGMDAPDEHGVSMKRQALDLLTPHADRLVFFGQTPHEQLYPLIRSAALVALPSLVDNLPNTCLEAMMLGRPVVGAQGASFEELITHGVTGFLTPPGDPDKLARTIREALERDDLDAIGEAAKQSVERLSPDAVAERHEEYYHSVVNA